MTDTLARKLLDEITTALGDDNLGGQEVLLSGHDPVVATPYTVGALGSAALGAVGAEASRLAQDRGGQPQTISVDAFHAAASLHSSQYLTIDGKKPDTEWAPIMGLYPVRGGRRVFIHANFPNLRDKALSVLGVPPDRERAELAALAWDGEELETAIHAAGGCASYVRTVDEWNAHPQKAAIDEEPLVTIQRIGDAPRRRLPAGKRPLDGVKVLDLTRVIAGPTASRTLAEHGADVLRITSKHLPSSNGLDIDTGFGKRAANADLNEPDGFDIVRRLAESADIVVQSYRPGSLERRGLGATSLAKSNPGIVYVSLTAWGTSGPWAARRGYDTIVQAATGMAAVQGGGASTPRMLPVSALDYVSGYLMAAGAMAALRRRAAEGGSWKVSVSLAGVGACLSRQGLVEADAVAALAPRMPDGALMAEIPTPFGTARYLRSPLVMSRTSPYFALPPVPSDFNRPVWADEEGR